MSANASSGNLSSSKPRKLQISHPDGDNGDLSLSFTS